MVRARGTSLQLLRGRARVAATSSPGKKGETLCRLPSGAQTPQGLGPQPPLAFTLLSHWHIQPHLCQLLLLSV